MALVMLFKKLFPSTEVYPFVIATIPQLSTGLQIMMLLRPYAPPVCPMR